MTTEEYIRAKNKIIYDATGLTLVPEEQIVDIDTKLVGKLSMGDDMKACPYCKVYLHKYTLENCKKCPMSIANNTCIAIESTYRKITKSNPSIIEIDKDRLSDLIDKYNEELEE